MTSHATTAAIKARATRPPTTPPAIAPAFELLLCEVVVGFDDEPDTTALGVMVDWETLVDEGTMGADPVTSGESERQYKVNICVRGTDQKCLAPPIASAAVTFQVSAI